MKYEWMTANEYGDSLGDDKSVLELEHVMVIPLCEYLEPLTCIL